MHYRNHLSPPIFPANWASDWGEDQYGLWMAFTYKGVRVVFRWIMPGTFMMGSPENEKGRFDNEDYHKVTISQGFWLGETTVTQALWEMVTKQNPSEFKQQNNPVEKVSWNDVQAFIEDLNQLDAELTVRLPWEAEWEYACRSGTETAFNFRGDLSLDKVNYRGVWEFGSDEWGEGARKKPSTVKSYPCNAWGLHEMHGNVWEWCQDRYQVHLGKDQVTDPWKNQSPESAIRVLRGGSWLGRGRHCRSARRYRSAPGHRNGIGFRLALGH